jgi:hypothetical protein
VPVAGTAAWSVVVFKWWFGSLLLDLTRSTICGGYQCLPVVFKVPTAGFGVVVFHGSACRWHRASRWLTVDCSVNLQCFLLIQVASGEQLLCIILWVGPWRCFNWIWWRTSLSAPVSCGVSTGWCSSRLWLIVKFAPVVFKERVLHAFAMATEMSVIEFFFNHRRCGLFFSSVCGRRICWWCTVVLSAVVLQGLQQFLAASDKVVSC